jgi:aspartate/methionine/tyrosine aminotransferase
MLSARTAWDRTPNRLTRLLEERRARGAPVLDLTLSNPTQAGIPYPPDLLAPLADAAAIPYEPSPLGLPAARAAAAADFARRGVQVEPAHVVITASTSEAYAFLFKLLCDPGDEVLVPRPSYPLFEYLAGLESVATRPYALRFDGEWHASPGALEHAVTPRTRALVTVHPNNPTGSFLKRGEAAALLAFCAERELALVSDEVFADYAFAADTRRFPTAAAGGPALAFALGGLSKSCGLPQVKVGWMAVAGPPALRAEALARLEIVADTALSVSTPAQRALPALLARREELQAPIRARVQANRAWLSARLPGTAASWPGAEGGWYAALRVPAHVPDEERVLGLLDTRGVLVHPGFFFDFEDEGHLVASLLAREADFRAGIEALLDVL